MQTLRARVSMPEVSVYIAEAGTLVNALGFPSMKTAERLGFSFHPRCLKRSIVKEKVRPAESTCNEDRSVFPEGGHLQDHLSLSSTSLLLCLSLFFFFSAPCQLIHIS